MIAAELICVLKFFRVEFFKHRFVFQRFISIGHRKILPESVLVIAAPIVAHHGGYPAPDGLDQRLLLIASGCGFLRQQLEIAARKFIHIHGEQRPIQIEQHHFD